MISLSRRHRTKPKLAARIDKENRKEKSKGKSYGGFARASTPFHEGILPSQYNMQESELERVGRKSRRKEW
jgi:hypothetical protein